MTVFKIVIKSRKILGVLTYHILHINNFRHLSSSDKRGLKTKFSENKKGPDVTYILCNKY